MLDILSCKFAADSIDFAQPLPCFVACCFVCSLPGRLTIYGCVSHAARKAGSTNVCTVDLALGLAAEGPQYIAQQAQHSGACVHGILQP